MYNIYAHTHIRMFVLRGPRSATQGHLRPDVEHGRHAIPAHVGTEEEGREAP